MEITDKTQVQPAAFPWLRHYPAGIPAQVNPDLYASIVALMEFSFERFADRVAFICMDKAITYQELEVLSRHFAAYLQSLGLKPGDKIAIQMPNVLQYPVAMYGAFRAGLTIVGTNPLYTPREMEHQFKDSNAKAIVILANFAHHLEKVLPNTEIKHVIMTEMGDLHGFPKKQLINFVVRSVKKLVPAYHLPGAVSFNEALAKGKKAGFERINLTGNDIAFIQYTGGTTGVSKGAMLTHRNVLSNVEMVSAWMGISFDPSQHGGTIVTPLPLYHIFSLTVNCISALRNGGTNLLIPNPRDIKGFLKELRTHKFEMITGVNTLFNGMLNHPDFATVDWSQLKIACAGGMALQRAVSDRWYKATGVLPIEGYGLSETSPVLSCNPTQGLNKVGTIGLTFPSTEMKAVKEDGTTAAIGEPGEIWARGPQVMVGYYKRPDETAKVMEGDWFKTGDIGVMDEDGFFKIVDRKKDMILVSGFNVYPNEVEDVIALYPKVLEVAVIGVPDEHSSEAVKAFIVKRDPSLTEQEIKDFCHENLTGYKRPKYVEFRSELPKSNVGKILRKNLREEEKARK
jgi:long-chain acyl-CoA synthetase